MCLGDFRTLFANTPLEAEVDSVDGRRPPKEARKHIDDMGFTECKSGVPVLYTSLEIHRGRIADSNGRRLMIRLCYSEYIKPRNAILVRR